MPMYEGSDVQVPVWSGYSDTQKRWVADVTPGIGARHADDLVAPVLLAMPDVDGGYEPIGDGEDGNNVGKTTEHRFPDTVITLADVVITPVDLLELSPEAEAAGRINPHANPTADQIQ